MTLGMADLLDESKDVAVERSSGRIVSVTALPVGAFFTADASGGATMLEVDDAALFDEIDGGQVLIAGTAYEYSASGVDTAADTLTIDTTLAADADTGDRVDVLDVFTGQVVVEWRADVAVPGSQINTQPVSAAVSQSLAIQLAQGVRDLAPGESVVMELRGTQWVIIDVKGEEPMVRAPATAAFPANVLTLSTTDAAANDRAIETAIAVFGGGNGTIYAPACPAVPGGYGVWPIAAQHDFLNTDLIGAGPGLDDFVGPPTDSYPATIFYCTTYESGFMFSGYGNVSGGWQINGGATAARPFRRTSPFGDNGRIFQNIEIADNAVDTTPQFDGMIVTPISDYAPGFDTFKVRVTNDSGTDTTPDLTLSTTTAADLQAAIEALSNVGAGNATVTDVVPILDASGVLVGGPWYYSIGGTSEGLPNVEIVGDTTGRVHRISAPYGAQGVMADISIDQSAYDVFINVTFKNAAEHGVYVNGYNLTFINCRFDGSTGHLLTTELCQQVRFQGCDFTRMYMSSVYGRLNNTVTFDDCTFSMYGHWSNSPVFDIAWSQGASLPDTPHTMQIANCRFFSQPRETPVIAVGRLVEVSLYGDIKIDPQPGGPDAPKPVLAIFTDLDGHGRLDNKSAAEFTYRMFYRTGTGVEQALGMFSTGLVSGGPVVLQAVATADRPTVGAAGASVFDTDLGQPIWSDGSGGWVDATGASV